MAPKSFKVPTPFNTSKALRVSCSRYNLSRTGGSKGAGECSEDFPVLGCLLRRQGGCSEG
ncbi:hypothetical protein PILCRDRAFT_826456 [Piloderma croceum F 1598]|uniref:Uncharacterized protein n=1 Tax=Piloderma croceum (strain F 1598) TaxID=765440 RepID=A0A0C3F994_PILCF|nr:hypothetical protein PILCRDRAFT_826456 [Piloderma croceum F 1598]